MTIDEVRLTEALVDCARDLLKAEPGWAIYNWTAFEMVMRRQDISRAQFKADKSYQRCLRAAFVEVNRKKGESDGRA